MTDELRQFARILQRIQDLGDEESGYAQRPMLRWEQMRDAFKSERHRQKGLTQAHVAKAGGVEQSQISKIESDLSYTPLVDTFVNAIHGLGLHASVFFAALEGLKVTHEGGKTALTIPRDVAPPAVRSPTVATDDDIQAFVLDLIEALQDVAARHDQRRATRTARAPHRKSPAARQTTASENPRRGSQR